MNRLTGEPKQAYNMVHMFFKDKEKYRDKFGIYKIVCLRNGMTYIGQTSTSFSRRLSIHKTMLNYGTHSNKRLQRDFDLFGSESFVFSVVTVCNEDDDIDKLETDAISQIEADKCYNVMSGGSNPKRIASNDMSMSDEIDDCDTIIQELSLVYNEHIVVIKKARDCLRMLLEEERRIRREYGKILSNHGSKINMQDNECYKQRR